MMVQTAAGNLSQTGYLTRNRILCVKQRAIATDFIETVEGPSRPEEIRKHKDRRLKMMITTPDRCSFKRLVNIFPDLKEQINEERTSYT